VQATPKINTLLSIGSITVTSLALSLNFIPVQQAQAVSLNLIQNGGFVPVANTAAAKKIQNDAATLPGWDSKGYNFLYQDGLNATSNTLGVLKLYSPNWIVNSADGSGWFVAADGAYQVGTISQTLNNLIIGQTYNLTFYQAAGQQQGKTGATTDRWAVNLGGTFTASQSRTSGTFSGGTTKLSTLMNLPSQAKVTSWQQQNMTFTAAATSQLLSFLAVGTPEGQPPFALLSGVSVNSVTVPEPFTIIGTLIGGTAAFRLRKKVEDSAK
jgi:hypothetical protein